MGLKPMSDGGLRACPLELKSSISTLQFLSSIPVLGHLVTLCVEVPLKLIANCFSSFRQTELGAHYANLNTKALVVSLFVPAIGPVISRIACRSFDHDRENTLLDAISSNNTQVLDTLFKTCKFSDENLRKAFDKLMQSTLDDEQKVAIFQKIYAASPSFQDSMIAHLKVCFRDIDSSSKTDAAFVEKYGVTDERLALMSEDYRRLNLRNPAEIKAENGKLKTLIERLTDSVGQNVHEGLFRAE